MHAHHALPLNIGNESFTINPQLTINNRNLHHDDDDGNG
jgi:hypothetical protein